MLMLNQMIILFVLMIVGFVCKKINLLDEKGSKTLSAIVVNVSNPALILSAGINPEETIKGLELLKVFGLSIGMFAVLMLLAEVLPRILGTKRDAIGSYKAMTVFSNIGFMGFPIINAVYGSNALLYASLFLIPYNLLIYTYGIAALGKAKRDEKDEEKCVGALIKKVLNVGVIACLVTIVLYLTAVPVPGIIEKSVGYLKELTAPLSMMVIGASMADMKPLELIKDWRMLIFLAIKMIGIPVGAVMLLKLTGMEPMLTGVFMVMLATPVGSMTAMLAKQYGGEEQIVSKGVAISTLLSVATLPLVSFITGA